MVIHAAGANARHGTASALGQHVVTSLQLDKGVSANKQRTTPPGLRGALQTDDTQQLSLVAHESSAGCKRRAGDLSSNGFDPRLRVQPKPRQSIMNEDQLPPQRHLTGEARALRQRLAAQFDSASVNDEQALVNALAMLEELQRDGRWRPAPSPT